MKEKIVLSASRTRDLVRCSPSLLAAMLMGKEPVRFSGAKDAGLISLDEVGALVLWTKNPANMYGNDFLRDALTHYTGSIGGIISVNITVTDLGGSFLEPGIPRKEAVRSSIKALISSDLVDPSGIVLRFDPIIAVRVEGVTVTNMDESKFESIAEEFSSLGIRRIKTSYVDYGYGHVPKRLRMLGIEPIEVQDGEVRGFIDKMKNICAYHGMRLDVCCNPASLVDEHTAGCIDGRLLNKLLADKGAPWRVTETLHNAIGRQRRTCMCTYSRDIGFSTGIRNCFNSDGACLYCYSQRNLKGKAIDMARDILAQKG